MSRAALFVITIAALLVASPARAWHRTQLWPGVGSIDDGVGVVEASPPSKEHPWGTIYAIGPSHERIDVIEWDLFKNGFVASKTLATRDQGPLVQPFDENRSPFPAPRDEIVHAVRRGDRIVVVIGSRAVGTVKVLELDANANVLSRKFIGRGRMPSLAVDDAWTVVGWYEDIHDDDKPGTLGFHVDVFDRKTQAVAGSRVFRDGAHLVERDEGYDPGRAIALLEGHAFLALRSEKEAFVLDTRLPSLAIEHRVGVADRKDDFPSSEMPHVYSVGSSIAVLAGAWLDLSDARDALVSRGGTWVSTLGPNASGSYVAVSAVSAPTRPGTAFVLKTKPVAHSVAIAWGHPIYLRQGRGYDPDDGHIGVGP